MLRWLRIRLITHFICFISGFCVVKKILPIVWCLILQQKKLDFIICKKLKIKEPKLKVVRHEAFFFAPMPF
jgi:hypothetical protein